MVKNSQGCYGSIAALRPESSLDAQQFFQIMVEERSINLVYSWSDALGTLFSLPFLLAFYLEVKEQLPLIKTTAQLSSELLELSWNIGSFLIFGVGYGVMAYGMLQAALGQRWLIGIGIKVCTPSEIFVCHGNLLLIIQ